MKMHGETILFRFNPNRIGFVSDDYSLWLCPEGLGRAFGKTWDSESLLERISVKISLSRTVRKGLGWKRFVFDGRGTYYTIQDKTQSYDLDCSIIEFLCHFLEVDKQPNKRCFPFWAKLEVLS